MSIDGLGFCPAAKDRIQKSGVNSAGKSGCVGAFRLSDL